MKSKNFHKPEKFKSKVVKTVFVETCGQSDHLGGCYIRFRNLGKTEKIVHTEDRHDVLVDYDKKGKIVGIEFYDGFKKECI